MLRAVTFDLWQTLILDTAEGLQRSRAARIRGVWGQLKGHDMPLELETVERAYDAVGERLEGIWSTLHDAGARAQVGMLLEAAGVAGRVAEAGRIMDGLVDAYCLPILDALPIANAGARETLAALRARGLRLGLICNTGRTPGFMLRIVLDRLGLAPYLSVLTFSDEVGLRKPHPEIFRRTLDALEVRPRDAVHVGDNPIADVAGARGAGMRGIHLAPAAAAPDADTIAGLAELPPLLHAASETH